MKTISQNPAIAVALLLFVWTVQPASAFYAPNVQRWVNRDPIGEDGGINLFVFAENDCVNEIDALGYQITNWQEIAPWPPRNPFPKHPLSLDKDQGIPNNSGSAPVARPVPIVRLPICKVKGDVQITKPPAPTGENCPCTNLPIRCFSYIKCELIPLAQGLNGTVMGLRWVPYTRCTQCPEY